MIPRLVLCAIVAIGISVDGIIATSHALPALVLAVMAVTNTASCTIAFLLGQLSVVSEVKRQLTARDGETG